MLIFTHGHDKVDWMARENCNDLLLFLTVARERSFTRAAAQLGISQSSLSHTVRALEDRLGVRLLTRTTRSVAVTQIGEHLVDAIGPHFDLIEEEVRAVAEYRERPAGNIRISSSEHAARTILWPSLKQLLPDYPDIQVEVVADYARTDIVEHRYDVGVRLGDMVAKDMIAVRIGPDMRMVVAAAPGYLARAGVPDHPQALQQHKCINLRLPDRRGIYPWTFKQGARVQQIRGDGQLVFNNMPAIVDAALAGFGLAWLPADVVAPHVQVGQLQLVLEDWSQTFSGYHLYYPNRRQSRALRVLVDALRYTAPDATHC